MLKGEKMRAYICNGYGKAEDVLSVVSMQKPIPKDGYIQIRIRATTVNSGDCRLRRADPFLVRLAFGLSKPKLPILGIVLAGEVTAVGKNVSRYKVGDALFGMTGLNQLGTFAEYVCVPETAALAHKPHNLSFEETAALVFGGHTALNFLRKAKIEKGQKVLIYGASGAVGTAAVQLAKYFGAEVTGVCGARNADLVKSLGADAVIDYQKTPLSQIATRFDVVFDTIGQNSAFDFEKLTAENGTLILGSMIGKQTFQSLWLQLTKRKKKFVIGTVSTSADDMEFLRKRAESAEFKPVIDTIYLFSEMVAAHNLVDSGRKRGNVVVSIGVL